MPNISTVVRTEKKYSITWKQNNTLIHRLALTMKSDENSGMEGYIVRSLYFDSMYDDDYFDKVDGLEFRKKIRLRIYSPDQDFVKLELKQKQGAAQKKRSLLISKSLAEEMSCGRYVGLLDIDSELSRQFYCLLEEGAYRPKCIVEYHRVAFMEYTNDIRITFDSEISTGYACEDFFKKDLALISVRKEPMLEIKYNGFLLSNIKHVLDFVDAPELAISKYAMSRQILGM